MSEAVTRGIRVSVESDYLPNHSSPESGRWVFAYQVHITNEGDEPVQLISRHWVITNGLGHSQEVRGPGVVGKQPNLEPGESFTYTSFCPLDTTVGTMHGTYQMISQGGERFDAVIDPFTLATPHAFN